MSPLDWFCIGYIIVSVIVMIIYFITDGDFVKKDRGSLQDS